MYTIAAIATPHAAGGISVIRISGDSAVSVAQTCFRSVTGKSLSEMPGYTCAYGKFCDPSGAELDDGIATVFRAPHSYTGEDTVEFSCHGGIFVTQQLLESVYAAGAVPAEPGEFTKRAFLAGKMTLTQAEAVMDVIGAAGKRELSFAHAQQNGALFHRVQQISQGIVSSLGDLAAWADYPEDEVPAVTPEGLHAALQPVLEQLDSTLATYDYGRILQSGVSAVIVGKPNVGKSTLFNLLSGSQRSIVTEIAGTTRDVVEEQIRLGNVTLRLSDTAGLRETEDVIEQMGVKIAEERLAQADLILAVFDTTRPLDADDRRMLEQLPDKPVIAILNKSDQTACLHPESLEQHGGKGRQRSGTVAPGGGRAVLPGGSDSGTGHRGKRPAETVPGTGERAGKACPGCPGCRRTAGRRDRTPGRGSRCPAHPHRRACLRCRGERRVLPVLRGKIKAVVSRETFWMGDVQREGIPFCCP